MGEGTVRTAVLGRCRPMRVLKKLVHLALLGFTAFWLVATSRAPEPTVECFAPMRSRSLELTLGGTVPSSVAGSGPSCRGIDGLANGSRLRVELTRSTKPPEVGRGSSVCWSYQPVTLSGPTGTSGVHGDEPSRMLPTALFKADAAFERPGPTCAGSLSLSLYVDGPFSAGMRADPLRAGAGETWRVRRTGSVKPGGPCPFKFPDDYCVDTFEVQSIAPAR